MVKKLLFAVFLFYTSFSYAETIKTDVLVIGGTASGAAAAIQSARSKVKTLLIIQGNSFDLGGLPNPTDTILKGIYSFRRINKLPSGIWTEFKNRIEIFYKGSSGFGVVPKSFFGLDAIKDITVRRNIPPPPYEFDADDDSVFRFEKYTGEAILKGIADTVKNLTMKANAQLTSIKKDGTGWEVSFTINGKIYLVKAKVVVDATLKNEAVNMAGAVTPPRYDPYQDDVDSKLYRTSIAAVDRAEKPKGWDAEFYQPVYHGVPMKYAIVGNADNILVTNSITALDVMRFMSIQFSVGQGVGCIAAYCAFFKTTTKDLKPRLIQQELLDYKGNLLPFTDIKTDYKYIRAVQQISATGLLKGLHIRTSEGVAFAPDTAVTTSGIKPVLTEIYSRAFLWFDKEKPGAKFTVGNTISLISEFTLTDPETLQQNLQKDWQDKYQFTLAFDKNRPITRLEFAVLVNKYLNPFARKIDLEGNMIN